MKPRVIVDTNVPVVANGRDTHASDECRLRCIDALLEVQAHYVLVVDASGFIIEEYLRHLNRGGQPGVGDAFLKWLWNNQSNSHHCIQVLIRVDDRRGFEEFPADPDLAGFDKDDRKFVAVALASSAAAPVLNATDSDWKDFYPALTRNGVLIKCLCPDHVRCP